MRRFLAGSVVALSLASASAARAEDNLTLQLPVLTWSQTNAEMKPDGGTSTKQKRSAIDTANPSDGYFEFTADNLVVYVWPWATDKQASVGYTISKNLELGIDLGLSQATQDKPKNDRARNLFGLYGTYYQPLAHGLTFEGYLIIDSVMKSGKEETTTAGVTAETKTNESGMNTKVMALFVKELTKHVSYVGGLSYAYNTNTVKDPTTAKGKTTEGTLQVNLATLRYNVN